MALGFASVAPFADAESPTRVLQDVDMALICRADISGPARGVPDGVINVMDVRHPSAARVRAPPTADSRTVSMLISIRCLSCLPGLDTLTVITSATSIQIATSSTSKPTAMILWMSTTCVTPVPCLNREI